MLQLRGTPALSTFRQEKLLVSLRGEVASIESVTAEFMHFVELVKTEACQVFTGKSRGC